MRQLELSGIGTAVPQHSICQDDAAQIARHFVGDGRSGTAVAKLYRRAGVGTRHSVVLQSSTNGDAARQSFYLPARSIEDRGPTLGERMRMYEKNAAKLGLIAARNALTDAKSMASRVTHLVTVSCTGFSAPGVDIELIKQLGLPSGVARTHLGFMGCHAMLNALRVADAFGKDPSAVILICAVELCSLHQQYGAQTDRIVSNSLFGDGAAAFVCQQSPEAALDSAPKPLLVSSASTILPETIEQMSWRLGDNGFEMSLSTAVPNSIRMHVGDWLEAWLREQGLALSDVQHWAVHPGGPRILDAVEESLDLPKNALDASRETLHRYGNMSSPTVAFVLERHGLMRAPAPCVLLGFGPGLTIEAALLC